MGKRWLVAGLIKDRSAAKSDLDRLALARLDWSTSLEAHPATAEIEYTPAQVEFGMAMEKWKRHHSGQMPTAREIIRVARLLGYRREN